MCKKVRKVCWGKKTGTGNYPAYVEHQCTFQGAIARGPRARTSVLPWSKQLFGVVFDPRPPTHGLAGVLLQRVRDNGLYLWRWPVGLFLRHVKNTFKRKIQHSASKDSTGNRYIAEHYASVRPHEKYVLMAYCKNRHNETVKPLQETARTHRLIALTYLTWPVFTYISNHCLQPFATPGWICKFAQFIIKALCTLQIRVISTGLVTLETSRPWEETTDLCVKTHKIPLGLKKDIFEAHCEHRNKAIRACKLYQRPRTRTSARADV